FKIPVPTLDDSVCSVRANSREADELRRATLIIWDEASMAHAYSVQAGGQLLRGLTRPGAPLGGKVVGVGGRLPPNLACGGRAARGGIVGASLKGSALWPRFHVLHLVQNMRTGAGEQAFAEWLLQLGDGRLPSDKDGRVELPADCLHRGDLVTEVFERALRGE